MSALGGIVLAGGRSRRMGQDKSLLRLGGRTLVERALGVLSPLCGELLLVTNAPERYASLGQRMVPDMYLDAGALGGLLTGLQSLESEVAIAVACDMPFLNGALLKHMASLAEGFDAVVPDLSEGTHVEIARTAKQRDLHPLHAIYRSTCRVPMERQVRAGDLRMIGFLDAVRVRYVTRAEAEAIDPALSSFFNVNTPDDWSEAERLARNGT